MYFFDEAMHIFGLLISTELIPTPNYSLLYLHSNESSKNSVNNTTINK